MQNNQFDDLDFDINYVIYSLPGYVFWKDLNFIYRGCNSNVAQVSNLNSPKEIIGKRDCDFEWGIKDAQKFMLEDKYVIETGEVLFSEWVMPHRNFLGLPYMLRTEKKPLLGKSGKIIGVIGFSCDISAEKEAERLRLKSTEHLAIIKENNKFRSFISKMAHDIKSPIMSLRNLVQLEGDFTEVKKATLKSASTTICDIAEHMLTRYSNDINKIELSQKILLPDIIEKIISEKRYEYKSLNILFVPQIKTDAQFAFIRVKPIQFKRMLSNVINNAIESTYLRTDTKKIIITLSRQYQDNYIISVIDNGVGMDKHMIDKIIQGDVVTTKKVNGYGIGLSQVREALTENFGTLTLDSRLGQGTIVNLSFSQAHMPPWFISVINVTNDSIIVILDDDPSIHGTWDILLYDVVAISPDIIVHHFNQVKAAIEYIDMLSQHDRQRVCFLFDYSLLKQNISNLDYIKQIGIKQAVLVTSYYTDVKIQDQILGSLIKILPKPLVPKVTIQFNESSIAKAKKVDAVWIDDALLELEDIIKINYKHLKIEVYEDPLVFLEFLEQYPLETKIICDYYFYFDYDERVKIMNGLILADKLYNIGYKDLYLCTAEDIDLDQIPHYLKYISKSTILESQDLNMIFPN